MALVSASSHLLPSAFCIVSKSEEAGEICDRVLETPPAFVRTEIMVGWISTLGSGLIAADVFFLFLGAPAKGWPAL